jgi:hypothetical protein
MTAPCTTRQFRPSDEHTAGTELDKLAATIREVRAGCLQRALELDRVEAHLSTSEISAQQAAALREAVAQARELGRRLLESLDAHDIRLRCQ